MNRLQETDFRRKGKGDFRVTVGEIPDADQARDPTPGDRGKRMPRVTVGQIAGC